MIEAREGWGNGGKIYFYSDNFSFSFMQRVGAGDGRNVRGGGKAKTFNDPLSITLSY